MRIGLLSERDSVGERLGVQIAAKIGDRDIGQPRPAEWLDEPATCGVTMRLERSRADDLLRSGSEIGHIEPCTAIVPSHSAAASAWN